MNIGQLQHGLCEILQHGLTVQYGLANTASVEHKVHLCQQLVELADIMLDGYRTQLESIKCHLTHQSKTSLIAGRYEETLRKYEQDRALLLAPLSMFGFVVRIVTDLCIQYSTRGSYLSPF